MSKKRKTKLQKLASEKRKEMLASESPVYSLQSYKSKPTKTLQTPSQLPSSNSYAYVMSDVRKSLTISVLIIGFNLLVFFLLYKNIISNGILNP